MKLKHYKGAGVALFKKLGESEGYGILLGKRSINPGKGNWSIPGGGFEQGKDKSLYENDIRECKEEIGIMLDNVITEDSCSLCKFRFPYFTWNTYMVDVGTWALPKIIQSEFSEIKLIPLRQIEDYDLAFGVKKEITIFKRKNKIK